MSTPEDGPRCFNSRLAASASGLASNLLKPHSADHFAVLSPAAASSKGSHRPLCDSLLSDDHATGAGHPLSYSERFRSSHGDLQDFDLDRFLRSDARILTNAYPGSESSNLLDGTRSTVHFDCNPLVVSPCVISSSTDPRNSKALELADAVAALRVDCQSPQSFSSTANVDRMELDEDSNVSQTATSIRACIAKEHTAAARMNMYMRHISGSLNSDQPWSSMQTELMPSGVAPFTAIALSEPSRCMNHVATAQAAVSEHDCSKLDFHCPWRSCHIVSSPRYRKVRSSTALSALGRRRDMRSEGAYVST